MVIYEVKCDNCDFHVNTGTGRLVYVTDDRGERIICPHPNEFSIIEEVLGARARSERTHKDRVGFLQVWVCLDCLSKSRLDLDKEEHRCGQCGSLRGKSDKELIDNTCPKCTKGTIRLLDTGEIT